MLEQFVVVLLVYVTMFRGGISHYRLEGISMKTLISGHAHLPQVIDYLTISV